ncbi:hypothetical protein LQ757_17850 [Agromyces sp. SYSU K20354]|uniref:hypothetical protein n=1 Tax=Agromyces cavernae TaxID=2898659 RepID=UPI001E509FFD|nr:hypothetical protein [Agromyces cavernae]MCD2444152.1 hypothetical protein [Agromyces cavernae]
MPDVKPLPDRTNQRRSSTGIRWIIILAVAGLVPAFFLSVLLALSIDEYQSYSAAAAEYGDTAALHADEALFGIQIGSFLLAVVWLLVTGIAAAIAARTTLPVVRTVLFVGGGLALGVGLVLSLGLTIGTIPLGELT